MQIYYIILFFLATKKYMYGNSSPLSLSVSALRRVFDYLVGVVQFWTHIYFDYCLVLLILFIRSHVCLQLVQSQFSQHSYNYACTWFNNDIIKPNLDRFWFYTYFNKMLFAVCKLNITYLEFNSVCDSSIFYARSASFFLSFSLSIQLLKQLPQQLQFNGNWNDSIFTYSFFYLQFLLLLWF